MDDDKKIKIISESYTIEYRVKILFIEPSQKTSKEPVIDILTRKMTASFRKARLGTCYLGRHKCACGAISSDADHILPNGWKTNSLCVHYLAYHRDEIPEEQIAKVALLTDGEEEPTERELQPPE